MKRLTILVDMDDTLENLSFAWCQYLNAHHGTNVPYEAINQWDISKAFPMLTSEQVYAPLYEDAFWDWVEPIDGAAEALQKMKEDGHDVLIVTASTYHTIKAKMEKVLFRYFPFLTWDDVIVTSRKQLIAGDVLIDDGVHNLVGGDYFKILFDRQHNRTCCAEENGMFRAHTWKEVYTAVRALSIYADKL